MMNKSKQRGVALLFALGMLTILLITGMAFVANALTAQKVAANNGARSQARVFAQSALSRVMASIMLYQYQVLKSPYGEFPDNYDKIQSYGKVNTGLETDDGLTGSDSLLKLPNDNSIISIGLAKQFNTALAESNDVKWVYFYDSASADERKIIGRAAWKVISSSPQISAPVFLSGTLPTDGTAGWYPSKHRWGREIDEVSFTSNSLFYPATQVDWLGQFKMQSYDDIYSKLNLGTSDDAKKRFIDRWFIPDAESSNFVSEPTPFVPEVYSYKENENSKVMQAMRFNISELSDDIENDKAWYEAYKVSAGADPWYARFGIDSTAATNTCNSDAFLTENFTIDSPSAAINDKFDYQLPKDDRPSLPFLRRIGNDKETFENLTNLRKQIAANFNDYCDADNIPTSDISAEKWMDEITAEYKHPAFTGNEKTPYIYELGFRFGVFPEKESKIDFSTTALPVTQESTAADGDGNYSAALSPVYASIAPIVKLVNIYNFDPGSVYSNFAAGVDFGALEIKFKPSAVTLKVEYTQTSGEGDEKQDVDQTPVTLEKIDADLDFNELTGTIADNVLKTSTVNITNDLLLNTTGTNPYPMMFPTADSFENDKNAKLTINDGKLTFKLSDDKFKSLASAADATAKVKKVTLLSVDAIEITSIKLNIKRATLSAAIGGKNIGLDYVKTMPELTWVKGSDGVTIQIPVKDGEKVPGVYIGGIRNYDPRQNLNPDDWYRKLTFSVTADILKPESSPQVKDVIKSSDINSVNDISTEAAENNKFNPGFNSVEKDKEIATEPGWRYNDGDADPDTRRLSTAYVRNAPMMSPWEIGLIHRGARWQTINISNACDPDDNSKNIRLTGHKPHNDSWEHPGTKYGGSSGAFGDAAILDQIKMTDQCATYGKINVNRLRQNDELFNKEGENLEHHIANALFHGIRVGEDINQFYHNSHREDGYFQSTSEGTGSVIGNLSESQFGSLTASRDPHTSRAHFIGWSDGHMENAYGTAADPQTDASLEEVIGKTVNLLCAETSSPSQIRVVVVAQVIKDAAGVQFRKNADGDNIQQNCEFGQFDYLKDGTDNYYYFDEIIGEVKMLVTIERDIATGRMTVRRTDYLE